MRHRIVGNKAKASGAQEGGTKSASVDASPTHNGINTPSSGQPTEGNSPLEGRLVQALARTLRSMGVSPVQLLQDAVYAESQAADFFRDRGESLHLNGFQGLAALFRDRPLLVLKSPTVLTFLTMRIRMSLLAEGGAPDTLLDVIKALPGTERTRTSGFLESREIRNRLQEYERLHSQIRAVSRFVPRSHVTASDIHAYIERAKTTGKTPDLGAHGPAIEAGVVEMLASRRSKGLKFEEVAAYLWAARESRREQIREASRRDDPQRLPSARISLRVTKERAARALRQVGALEKKIERHEAGKQRRSRANSSPFS